MDISIVIVTYNYEKYIRECINSCLQQNCCNIKYEIIVIDDGSTDNTPNILNQIYSDNLRFYRIANSGIEKAANYGFKRAKGKYILRVDADDILFPNYLETIGTVLDKKYGFFYSNYSIINSNGDYVGVMKLPRFQTKEILNRGDFLATGTLFRSDILKETGGYNTDIVNSGLENYELVLKLIMSGISGKNISDVLFGYRIHGKNMSKLKKENIITNGKKLFIRKGLGNFSTNKYHPLALEVD